MRESLTNPIKAPIFKETFSSEYDCRRNGSTPVNSPTFTNGQMTTISASSQYLTFPKKRIDTAGAFSIRVKVKMDSLAVNNIFIANEYAVGNYEYCGYISADGKLRYSDEGNNLTTYTGTTISAGVLYDIVFVGTSAKTDCYVNGVLQTPSSSIANDKCELNQIGRINVASYYSSCTFELIECYNYSLTSSQVANMYSNKTYRNLNSGSPSGQGTQLFTGMVNGSTYSMDNFIATASGFTSNGAVTTSYEGCVSNSLGTVAAAAPVTIEFDVVYSGTSTLRVSLSTDQTGASGVVTISLSLTTGHYVLHTTNTTSGARYLQFTTNNTVGATYNIAVSNLKIYYPTTYKNLILSVDAFSGAIQNRVNSTALTNTSVSVVKDSNTNVMSFNGTSSKLDCGAYDTLVGNKTIIAWVKMNRTTANQVIFGNTSGIIYGVGYADRLFYFSRNYSATPSSLTSVFEWGKWVQVAVITKSDGKTTHYINGVVSNTADQNAGTPVAGGSMVLGFNDAKYFNGRIASVKIYDGILSIDELTQEWSSTRKNIY